MFEQKFGRIPDDTAVQLASTYAYYPEALIARRDKLLNNLNKQASDLVKQFDILDFSFENKNISEYVSEYV